MRTHLRALPIIAAVAVLAAALTTDNHHDIANADDTTPPPARHVSGWHPYWSDWSPAEAAAGGIVLQDYSPFAYQVTGGPGNIVAFVNSSRFDNSIAQARAAGTLIIPSIVDGSERLELAGWLNNRTHRNRHIAAIVQLVETRNYDGIDLDYEGFAFVDGRDTWATTRPGWVRFVRDLSAALHNNGRLLSITVPPIWNNGTSGYQVYAWDDIIDHIDRLRIMAYDYSWSHPGPIAPTPWVKNVMAYAETVAPVTKLQLGVPAYGRSWATVRHGTCHNPDVLRTRSVTTTNAPAALRGTGAHPRRDKTSGEMVAKWREHHPGCTIEREMWWPNARSIRMRVQLAETNGWFGSILWALSYETPRTWTALNRIR
jgi:spore germination protein YaaH